MSETVWENRKVYVYGWRRKKHGLFKDEEFDFVLFSFNGIDLVNHEDRLKALNEIHRILKTSGYFCFSSHNLNWSWNHCIIKKSGLCTFLRAVHQVFLVRLYNWGNWSELRKQNKKSGHIIVNDGVHNFGVNNYYIKPVEQIKQLTETKFRKIRAYNLSGKQIDPKGPEVDCDAWVYYLCQK